MSHYGVQTGARLSHSLTQHFLFIFIGQFTRKRPFVMPLPVDTFFLDISMVFLTDLHDTGYAIRHLYVFNTEGFLMLSINTYYYLFQNRKSK